MKYIKGLGQRGDTLVEVLICILIVSMILTGAYVTTNKSTIRVIDSQERAEGLKLVQGQLEQIRQNATTASPNIFDQPVAGTFCMVNGAIVNGTNANCRQDRSGAAAPVGVDPAYQIAARRTACDPTLGLPTPCSLFTVRATWNSISTKGQAYQEMSYRLYQ